MDPGVVVTLDELASLEVGVSLWPLYDATFGDASRRAWLSTWERHRARAGFRVVRAVADNEVVGFAYGYTGEAGQWWTDAVRATLPSEVADTWLGGHFELVSLGVSASARGGGLGRRLLRRITADLPHARLLLQASADPGVPARRLYASDGWVVLGPGTGGDVVLGRARRSVERR